MITETMPVVAPVVPELDRPDGDAIGDEILLDSVAAAKIGHVSGSSSTLQSHTARAWTRSGQID